MVKMFVRFNSFISVCCLLFIGHSLQASQVFYIDGTLYSDGSQPVFDNIGFTVQIVDTSVSPACVLYEENQASKDLSLTNGSFNLAVGASRAANHTELSLEQIFANSGETYALTDLNDGICNFTADLSAKRELRIHVVDSALNEDYLNMEIGSVPSAMVANSLQGHGASDFIRVNAEKNLSQSNIEEIFNEFDELKAIIGGNSSQYVTRVSGGGSAIPEVSGDLANPSTGEMWFDTTAKTVKYFDGASIVTVGGSGGTLSETDIPTLTTGGKVSGSAITSGNINTDGDFQTSGNIKAESVSVNALGSRSHTLFTDDINQYVTIMAPSSANLQTNYTLRLPHDAGVSGQVLSTDGSGELSWSKNHIAGLTGSGVVKRDSSGNYSTQEIGSSSGNIPKLSSSLAPGVLVKMGSSGLEPFSCNNGSFAKVSGGEWSCGSAVGIGTDNDAFHQSGDSFGEDAILGTDDPHSLSFKTSGTTRMTLAASGNVGIGTNTPKNPLHILNEAGGTGLSPIYPMRIEGYAGNNHNYLVMKNTATSGSARGTGIRVIHEHTGYAPSEREKAIMMYENESNQWRFYAGDGSASYLTTDDLHMVINHSGEVGIGDSTPTSALSVARDEAAGDALAVFKNSNADSSVAKIDLEVSKSPGSRVSLANNNGHLDVGGVRVIDVGPPTTPTDAATKGYVDNVPVAHITARSSASYELDSMVSNEFYQLTFDNEIFDDANIWRGGSSQITDPGYYELNLNLRFSTDIDNTNQRVSVWAKINAQEYIISEVYGSQSTHSNSKTMNGSIIVKVANGENLILGIKRHQGSNMTFRVYPESNISIRKIRPL